MINHRRIKSIVAVPSVNAIIFNYRNRKEQRVYDFWRYDHIERLRRHLGRALYRKTSSRGEFHLFRSLPDNCPRIGNKVRTIGAVYTGAREIPVPLGEIGTIVAVDMNDIHDPVDKYWFTIRFGLPLIDADGCEWDRVFDRDYIDKRYRLKEIEVVGSY